MQIIGIDGNETNRGQIAFATDPPITKEIFALYSQMMGINNIFKLKGHLLIARRLDLRPDFLNQTAEHLTQIESEVRKTRESAEKAHQKLLQRLSKQSGLPITGKPPVTNPGGSSGDADQK